MAHIADFPASSKPLKPRFQGLETKRESEALNDNFSYSPVPIKRHGAERYDRSKTQIRYNARLSSLMCALPFSSILLSPPYTDGCACPSRDSRLTSFRLWQSSPSNRCSVPTATRILLSELTSISRDALLTTSLPSQHPTADPSVSRLRKLTFKVRNLVLSGGSRARKCAISRASLSATRGCSTTC